MRRRDFIGIFGSAAAWPLAARAQQPALPVIGFLDSRSPDALMDRLRGFRLGLKENGYVEGDNATVTYRWAENNFDRLPELAADLVRRRVAVIAATGPPPVTFAAKAATATMPIVFLVAEDPVRLGLVASLAHPGGNLTGVNFLGGELVAKQVELIRELVSPATRVAVLVNPANVTSSESRVRQAETAARAMALQIQVVRASTSGEIISAQRCRGCWLHSAASLHSPGAPKLVDAARQQTASLGNFASMTGAAGQSSLIEKGSQMLSSLLGGRDQTALAGAVGKYAGWAKTRVDRCSEC